MVASWEVVLAGNRTPLGPLAIDLGPAAPTAPASNFSVTLACQEAAGGPSRYRSENSAITGFGSVIPHEADLRDKPNPQLLAAGAQE